MKTYTKILLDNGHGINTPGKRSPDGTFLEYEFNRDIVARVIRLADIYEQNTGTPVVDRFVVLVPETEDVPLGLPSSKFDCRVKRANRIWEQDRDVLLVSVHANAASNGEWKNAKGFGVFYDRKHGEPIVDTAKVFVEKIGHYSKDTFHHEYSMPIRGNMGLVETNMQYSIIAFPYCHSLLLELGFMDNKEEVEYLKSSEGRHEISLGIFAACIKSLGLEDMPADIA